MIQFQVRRDDFSCHRLQEAKSAELSSGQVRLAMRQFALTANNMTYVVTGERLGYWRFFPATGDAANGWGIMPVWGFAEVTESQCSEVLVGERLYGFLPAASELVMTPVDVTDRQCIDGTEHRTQLPAVYNRYRRVLAEPGYDGSTDNERMLLGPLLTTSWCLCDALRDRDWFGAQQVIVVSASSKTSIGLSYALNNDSAAPPVTGLTSSANLDFVSGLGTYDRGLSYNEIDQIDASVPAVVVDMSGNGDVLGRLQRHLGDSMKWCLNVGITHWDQAMAGDGINRERSEMFFAPAHIQQRIAEWGAAEFDRKIARFMADTGRRSRDWMQVRRLRGLSEMRAVFDDVRGGRISAREGLVVDV